MIAAADVGQFVQEAGPLRFEGLMRPIRRYDDPRPPPTEKDRRTDARMRRQPYRAAHTQLRPADGEQIRHCSRHLHGLALQPPQENPPAKVANYLTRNRDAPAGSETEDDEATEAQRFAFACLNGLKLLARCILL